MQLCPNCRREFDDRVERCPICLIGLTPQYRPQPQQQQQQTPYGAPRQAAPPYRQPVAQQNPLWQVFEGAGEPCCPRCGAPGRVGQRFCERCTGLMQNEPLEWGAVRLEQVALAHTGKQAQSLAQSLRLRGVFAQLQQLTMGNSGDFAIVVPPAEAEGARALFREWGMHAVATGNTAVDEAVAREASIDPRG